MNPSFSDEEKRFVLAEIIKTSRLSVDALIYFIKFNNVKPSWMDMQLPHGRTINQCIQAAELMTIMPPSQKRKVSDDQAENPNKRPTYPGQLEQSHIAAMGVASKPHSHKPLLPRPPEFSLMASQPQPQPQPQLPVQQPSPGPKKRGRPSRFDKSRKLHPNLPQMAPQMAPQVAPPSHPAPTPQGTRSVAMAQPSSNIPADPATGNIPLRPEDLRLAAQNEQTSTESGLVNNRSLDPILSHLTTPRVLPEPPPQYQLEGGKPATLSSPVPIEPEPRATAQSTGSPRGQGTTLAPLLEREGEIAPMGSSYPGTQAPLANSA